MRNPPKRFNLPNIEAETAEDQGSHHDAHLAVESVSSLHDIATIDGFVMEDAKEELAAEDDI